MKRLFLKSKVFGINFPNEVGNGKCPVFHLHFCRNLYTVTKRNDFLVAAQLPGQFVNFILLLGRQKPAVE